MHARGYLKLSICCISKKKMEFWQDIFISLAFENSIAKKGRSSIRNIELVK